MSSTKLTAQNSYNQLQRAFETAVTAPRPQTAGDLWYRTPIGRRISGAPATPAEIEKKDLANAAQALAQLWKIAPSHGR